MREREPGPAHHTIEALLKLPEAELTKQLEELKAALDEKEKAHEKFVEGLQAPAEAGPS